MRGEESLSSPESPALPVMRFSAGYGSVRKNGKKTQKISNFINNFSRLPKDAQGRVTPGELHSAGGSPRIYAGGGELELSGKSRAPRDAL